MTPTPVNPALLVVDPQNDFFDDDNCNLAEFRRVLPKINTAIALCRKQRWPVVFVQHTSLKKPAGSREWSIYPGVDCRREDLRLNKAFSNAFWQTDLEEQLKARGVNYVVVVGFMAEHCVLSTYRGARERNFQAAVLRDGIAGEKSEYTRFVYETSATVTLNELQPLLANGKPHTDDNCALSALIGWPPASD
jgi:nicotinamidase-related amidase